jgi:hypothetical protein
MGEEHAQEACQDRSQPAAACKNMTEKSVVRIATRHDEPQLLDLCHALHADNGLFAMDDDMVRRMLNRAFDREGGIVGIIDGDGELAAAIYLLLSNFWYSRENHLEELFSFIRPAYRKSRYIDQLTDFAKECSAKIGIPLIIGIMTNKNMEEKVRLYRRKFGLPAGAFFVVGGKWKNDSVMDQNIWRGHRRKRALLRAS